MIRNLSGYKTPMQMALILFFIFFTTNSSAAVECQKNESPWIQGKIVKGDLAKLLSCLNVFIANGLPKETLHGKFRHKKIGWVWFNSEGGDVDEAMKIGRFLRESLADVGVSEQCSSACYLAIVGSVKITAPFAKIGIHRVFFDSETLKQTDVKDYESYYNELKKGIRQYCYDMDVPTPIVEKMFSISSREIYYLSGNEQVQKHPAYEEWINSKCPDSLIGKEKEDHKAYVRAGFRNMADHSEGYIEYLRQKNSNYEKCEDTVRWAQFEKTVAKYLK